MYHRIEDDPVDYWGLAVSPANFEEHLRVLRGTRRPLPLSEFVSNLVAGTLSPDAVALTFDDGYVDNLINAKPRLAAAEVPATVFVTTGYTDSYEAFWWDELAKLILHGNAPQLFTITICGESLQFDFGVESPACDSGNTSIASLHKRRTALWTLRQALRPLLNDERRQIMNTLRSTLTWPGRQKSLGRAMTSEELREIISDGLVTIGAHTVTHPMLSTLNTAACCSEITESKLSCETLIEAPVTAFAYPYGDFDVKSREAVKAAGFTLACSVERGTVNTASDIFALPRIYVPNLDGEAFERCLRSA